MSALRPATLFGVVLAAMACIGWRILATSAGDLGVAASAEHALEWDPRNPAARLALARRALHDGDRAAARTAARALLRDEPLAASALGVLAQASEGEGDDVMAERLHAIALRRAPRDPNVRAWTIDRDLARGRYDDALAHLSVLLRVWPSQQRMLLPVMVDLSRAPAFADAMLRTLSTHPAWRAALLDALLARGDGATVDRIFEGLDVGADLSIAESGAWLERLMRDGRWSEAYGRWASGIGRGAGAALPALYNGGFEHALSNIGFDWRVRAVPGVYVERVRAAGASGEFALKIAFAHRRVPAVGLSQTTLLAPGSYRLSYRARTEDLQSDRGIEWAIACEGASIPLAEGQPLTGRSDWTTYEVTFEVPAADCVAQRLGLRNPGAGGPGKMVSGIIWLDDMRLEPLVPVAPR
ncbi:hypothetical protein [Dokdonella sp.]|uniref:hypothetical protein n=1 Tax=Dokdonella sp. TaxID=2291710 RepID=UPI002F41A05C